MKLEDYIKKAKKELDDFEIYWREENRKSSDPDMWPLALEEEDWGEQELAARFSG